MNYVRLLIIIFIVSITTAGIGQSDISSYLEKLNELKKVTDPVARDTQLIWQYNYIAEELARYQDERTEAFIDTLQLLSEKSDWKPAEGFFLRAKGRYHEFRGEFTEALDNYDKAIQAYTLSGVLPKELAFTYVLKGFLLSNSDLYQECWKTLEEGLPIARAANGKNSLCLMLDWFGDYYYYGLEGTRDNEKALDYYLQVQEILPQISYMRIIADNHAVLSGTYARLGRDEKAQYHFEIADSLAEKNNLPFVRWGMYAETGRVWEDKGEFQKANDIYLQAAQFVNSSPNIEFKARLEEVLYNNYKNMGQYEKALEHYETYISYEDKMSTDDVKKRYDELETKYNVAQKENQIIKLQSSRSRSNRNMLLGLLAVIFLAGAMIMKKNASLKKSYQKLAKKTEEVKGAMYQGETQERHRVAAELHDNVNTKLAAARWRLEAISDGVTGNSKEILDSTIDMMNEAYQDVRNISHNLVPSQLEEKGLIESIKSLIQKINSSNNVRIFLEDNGLNEEKVGVLAYPIYNVISELLNNVMKHAHAANVIIKAKINDEFLHFTVTDDGKGYDVSESKNGFGLRSISSRVKAMDGNITMSSEPGKGSSTTFIIPVI